MPSAKSSKKASTVDETTNVSTVPVDTVKAATKATTKAVKFDKPKQKGACKIVDAGAIDELIDLLHNEAKVI